MRTRTGRTTLNLFLTSTVTVGLLAVELFAGGVASASAPPAPDAANVPIIVTADAPLDAATVARVTGGTGRVTDTIDAIGATVVEVPAARAVEAVRRLDAVPGVDSAQRDQEVRAFDRTPTDPYWGVQSSLRDIGAPAAWSTSVGSPSVIIAVVDSGVDEVDDLAGRVLPGYDFVNNDAVPADDYGHGTATSLVAAAAGDDGGGLAGMCWTCKILPVKVLDDDGLGAMFDVADGIVWATDHGADVINLSLGGRSSEPAVTAALNYAFAHDVVVVASAGNDGKTERSYPAADAGVISVAGIANSSRSLFPSSRRSPLWVDVAAPWCNYVFLSGSPDSFCGTSSSAPVVTGIAALLRSIRPGADRQMVATSVLTTADFPPTAGLVAYGIVDAGRAVGAIGTVSPGPVPLPPDVTPPTVSVDVPGGYVGGVARVWVGTDDDQAIALDELYVGEQRVATYGNPAGDEALDFDTRAFADGPHTVRAYTSDRAGHRVPSDVATIVVDNVNPVGILTSPAGGSTVTGSFVARVFVTDPNGIMGTFLVANDRIVGGFLGAGWGEATVPVGKTGPIRVVAITVDNAGRISGTNTAVVNGVVARRRGRR